MRKQSTESLAPSRTARENLEAHLRGRAQGWLQDLSGTGLDEFLGRAKSQRRAAADASAGYRNGHGARPRKLNAPELLKEVYQGTRFPDGMRADTLAREAAA